MINVQSIRLIALDLDGTVIESDGTISGRTCRVLQLLRQRGLVITVATGRPYQSARPYIEQLGISGLIVCCNGALIFDAAQQCIVQQSLLPPHIVRHAVNEARIRNIHIQGHGEDSLLYEKRRKESITYEAITGLRGKEINFDTLHDPQFYKMLVIGERTSLIPMRDVLKSQCGDAVSLMFSSPYYMEVMRGGVDKATGLAYILQVRGWNFQHVLMFGDAMNDETALEKSGIGVVMRHGEAELVKRKHFHKASEHEGVAKFLEPLVDQFSYSEASVEEG